MGEESVEIVGIVDNIVNVARSLAHVLGVTEILEEEEGSSDAGDDEANGGRKPRRSAVLKREN